MGEKIQALNTVAKIKQWDKRKAGLQVDYQEEADLLKYKIWHDNILGEHEQPRKDI